MSKIIIKSRFFSLITSAFVFVLLFIFFGSMTEPAKAVACPGTATVCGSIDGPNPGGPNYYRYEDDTGGDPGFCAVFPELSRAEDNISVENYTKSTATSSWDLGWGVSSGGKTLAVDVGDHIVVTFHGSAQANGGPTWDNTVDIPSWQGPTPGPTNYDAGQAEVDAQACDGAAFASSWVQFFGSGTPTPTPSPSPLPRIGLTKIQSTLVYPTNSDAAGVVNTQSSLAAPGMSWNGSTANSWITSLAGGLESGKGLPSLETSMGSFNVDVTQANIGINNGSIVENCDNCESGYSVATLGVQYTVPGPGVTITANPAGPVVAGTPVTLTWTGTNCNATAPVSSSNFGASTCSGSTVVTPIAPSSTYTITIKGLSDVDASANNFSTGSVTVSVSASGNQAPSVSKLDIGTNYCFTGPNQAVMNWKYSDPDDVPVGTDPQSAFQIQVDIEGSSFNPPAWDSGKVLGSQTSYTATGLPLGKTLKARMRVWDSHDLVSAWSIDSGTWKSAATAYPKVDFCWPENCNAPSPGLRPKANSPIPFTDRTIFYDGSNRHSWSWTFGDGGSSVVQNPTHTYLDSNSTFTITLTATDSNNQSCTVSKLINVQRSIPIWREISPGQ